MFVVFLYMPQYVALVTLYNSLHNNARHMQVKHPACQLKDQNAA